MTNPTLNLVQESDAGKLYNANGFLVPVLAGTWHEMGSQYGALMVNHMQTTWDVLVAPAMEKGAITDDEVRDWATRAQTKCSTRNRQWYEGVAAGSS